MSFTSWWFRTLIHSKNYIPRKFTTINNLKGSSNQQSYIYFFTFHQVGEVLEDPKHPDNASYVEAPELWLTNYLIK